MEGPQLEENEDIRFKRMVAEFALGGIGIEFLDSSNLTRSHLEDVQRSALSIPSQILVSGTRRPDTSTNTQSSIYPGPVTSVSINAHKLQQPQLQVTVNGLRKKASEKMRLDTELVASNRLELELLNQLRETTTVVLECKRTFESQNNDLRNQLGEAKAQQETMENDLRTASQTQLDNQRKDFSSQLLETLKQQCNCCICDEIFVKATVIDCGHTFCKHCIETWSYQKKQCPICRARITRRIEQVEMENLVRALHDLMLPEVQSDRNRLLMDRYSEVNPSMNSSNTRSRRNRGNPRTTTGNTANPTTRTINRYMSNQEAGTSSRHVPIQAVGTYGRYLSNRAASTSIPYMSNSADRTNNSYIPNHAAAASTSFRYMPSHAYRNPYMSNTDARTSDRYTSTSNHGAGGSNPYMPNRPNTATGSSTGYMENPNDYSDLYYTVDGLINIRTDE